MSYQKLKDGWDNAAANNANAAIHPSGAISANVYDASGQNDVLNLLNAMYQYDISAEDLTSKILIEYGCGNGRMTNHLIKHFNLVYAVDMSYGMLQQLEKKDRIVPILSNENAFLVPGDQADFAVSLSVFIHNSFEQGQIILAHLAENLKTGALAFLQIPVYDESRQPNGWTDVGVWTEKQLYDAAQTAGFHVAAIWTNPGKFDYNKIGPNHSKYQVLEKL